MHTHYPFSLKIGKEILRQSAGDLHAALLRRPTFQAEIVLAWLDNELAKDTSPSPNRRLIWVTGNTVDTVNQKSWEIGLVFGIQAKELQGAND